MKINLDSFATGTAISMTKVFGFCPIVVREDGYAYIMAPDQFLKMSGTAHKEAKKRVAKFSQTKKAIKRDDLNKKYKI